MSLNGACAENLSFDPFTAPVGPSVLCEFPFESEQLRGAIQVTVYNVLGEVDSADPYSARRVFLSAASRVSLISSQIEAVAMDSVTLSDRNDGTFSISAFETQVPTQTSLISVIPEPMAVGLLGSGGLILFIANRFRRRS